MSQWFDLDKLKEAMSQFEGNWTFFKMILEDVIKNLEKKEITTATIDKIELFIDGKQIHYADSMELTYTIEPNLLDLKPPKTTCRLDIKMIKEV